jgi:hypothetical protein
MRFLLSYHGPAIPPSASHEGRPEWFSRATVTSPDGNVLGLLQDQ